MKTSSKKSSAKKNKPTGPKFKLLPAKEQVSGEICICLGRKFKHQSFCNDCVMELPKKLRLELWMSWDDGFEEHYLRARDWLMENSPRLQSETLFEDTSDIGPASGVQEG